MLENFIDGPELESRESVLAAENAELRDRLLRALADVENTRLQAEGTASNARQFAVLEFAREMLGVADNLKRAIAVAESQPRQSTEDGSLIQGVRATERLLESVFERCCMHKITAIGAPFDPNFHEAIMEVDDASSLPGTVSNVFEDGYTLHDRLVRPARVAIVRRRSNSSKVRDAETLGFIPQSNPPNYHE